jgi:hypothetical protein
LEVNPEEIIGKYWQRIDTKFSELRQELEKLGFKSGIEVGKFTAFWKLKRFRSIREGHACLRGHPDACKKLGFKKLPTYELLREFLNERLPRLLGALNDEVLVEADKELQEHTGQRLFEEISRMRWT